MHIPDKSTESDDTNIDFVLKELSEYHASSRVIRNEKLRYDYGTVIAGIIDCPDRLNLLSLPLEIIRLKLFYKRVNKYKRTFSLLKP